MEIPFNDRVSVRIRYNGYIHNAVALRGKDDNGHDMIHIFYDQLPKSFHAEHGAHQIDYVFETDCILHDSSGRHAWAATEEADLDFFAGKSAK